MSICLVNIGKVCVFHVVLGSVYLVKVILEEPAAVMYTIHGNPCEGRKFFKIAERVKAEKTFHMIANT